MAQASTAREPASSLSLSIIVPCRPGATSSLPLSRLAAALGNRPGTELIVIEGTTPPHQRNVGVRASSGEVLYFLDDDSHLGPGTLEAGLNHLCSDAVTAVGGPAAVHEAATDLERSFAAVLASWWGGGRTRARLTPVGRARQVNGEELILCNLLMRRSAYDAVGGFNLQVYPGEENELFKRMGRDGYRFFYEPAMLVHRTWPSALGGCWAKAFSYGRGRGSHIFSHPTVRELPFLVPLLLVLYLTTAAWRSPLLAIPAALYLLGTVMNAVAITKERTFAHLLRTSALFLLVHSGYGLGTLVGLFERLFGKRRSAHDACTVNRYVLSADREFVSDEKSDQRLALAAAV